MRSGQPANRASLLELHPTSSRACEPCNTMRRDYKVIFVIERVQKPGSMVNSSVPRS